MDATYRKIIETVRDLSVKKGVKDITPEDICRKANVSKDVLRAYFKDNETLVSHVLDYERESFKVIFDDHNFENVNAIDILLIVSKEVSRKFMDVSPSVTFEIKRLYPSLYQEHFQKRIDFIFNKIKINIEKGINQGMYREDLSVELVSRLYISRLIDIHNPEFFPPKRFSFQMLFEVMFENLIRSIATKEGMKYYEDKVKDFNFHKK